MECSRLFIKQIYNLIFFKIISIYVPTFIIKMAEINDFQEPNFSQNSNETLIQSTTKRLDYISWHEYFMATAFLAAKRSKDPITQVGACIVNGDFKIVGIGYNGMPIGCSDDEFSWSKEGKETKHLYVCHAEMNAIINKNVVDVKDCIMYVALFPCNECAKFIIQSGIKEVVYMSDKHSHKRTTIASKKMFNAAGVKYWQYIPKNKSIVIDFTEIDWNNMQQMPLSSFKELSLHDLDTN